MKSFNILTVMAIVAILSFTSCSSKSGNRQTEVDRIEKIKDQQGYPIWNIMNKKSLFTFHDKENKVFPMKSAGLDSIMIVRVTVIHSDTTKSEQNLFLDWEIPGTDEYPIPYFKELDGNDTIHHYYNFKVFPVSAFKLKR